MNFWIKLQKVMKSKQGSETLEIIVCLAAICGLLIAVWPDLYGSLLETLGSVGDSIQGNDTIFIE